MIIGIGTDVVSVNRLQGIINRREGFLSKVFTDNEIAYCSSRSSKFQSLAARFAAKEAVFKSLGTGWAGNFEFTNVEIVNDNKGRPAIHVNGPVLTYFESIGVERCHLSLSHEGDIAVAYVVLETGKNQGI